MRRPIQIQLLVPTLSVVVLAYHDTGTELLYDEPYTDPTN